MSANSESAMIMAWQHSVPLNFAHFSGTSADPRTLK